MNDSCFICERIELIKKKENPYFVKELSTGFVVLGDNQFYKGLTFFLSKQHKSELHELDKEFRDTFLSEMADVAEAVHKAFKPRKINYELLGNRDNHLHWWIVPRHFDDPNPKMPIWVMDKEVIFSENTKPPKEELKQLVDLLRSFL
jgi:diadenosine tetraphosphate (Ap4A) HIT family hydrolase